MTDFSTRLPTILLSDTVAQLAAGHALLGDRWRCIKVPDHVIAWALQTGHRFVTLTLTDSGTHCAVKAGAMTYEFDGEVDHTREVEYRIDRKLMKIPTGELTLEGGK